MSPKWASPGTGADRACGEKELDRKAGLKVRHLARDCYWDHIVLSKPQDKDRVVFVTLW